MSAFANVVAGGVFHAAVLFLVAAGLQLVFGVQKIVNLACGSFYALGAYFGITFIGYAHQFGVSEWLILPGLIISGLLLGFIGPPIERLLRTVYDRDESFQLLLTFALLLTAMTPSIVLAPPELQRYIRLHSNIVLLSGSLIVLTIVVLAGFIGTSRAPRALGIPYQKEK